VPVDGKKNPGLVNIAGFFWGERFKVADLSPKIKYFLKLSATDEI